MELTQKLVYRRFHYWLVAGILLLTTVLVGWYVNITMTNQNWQFLQETRVATRSIREHVDTVIIRVKDLSSFAAAGLDSEVDEKLRRTTRLSPYLKEIGFFYSDKPEFHKFYLTDKTEMTPTSDDAQKLVGVLAGNIGLVSGFNPASFPGIMGKHPDKDLVLVEALPIEDKSAIASNSGKPRYLISYGILDLEQVLLDLDRNLNYSRIVESRYQDGASPRVMTFHANDPNNLFLPIIDKETASVVLSRNLTLIIDFREVFPEIVALALFLAGLLLVALISTALFFFFERRSKSVLKEMRLAADRERAANSAKSEFLANMSHEIRTPLNGVLGMAELLSRSNLTPTQQRYAEQIKTSGSVLLAILNDILDMSKLESGRLAIDPVRIDLPSQLQETATFYTANANDKNLALLLDVDPSVPRYVEIDPMRLRQILGNLISNAIKFTASGEVVVSSRFQPEMSTDDGRRGMVEISVTDSGIGMTEAEMAHLFERFSQANTGTTKKYGGTGLGLSICKQLANAMGGTITVSSVRGKGSTFTVTLPVKVLPAEKSVPVIKGRIALVSGSDSSIRIVDSALAQLGARARRFRYSPNLATEIISDAMSKGMFDLIIFDAEGDIHRSKDEWHAVRSKISSTVMSIVLGDKQVHRNYREFDNVLIKPFLGTQLADIVQDMLKGKSNTSFSEEKHQANPPTSDDSFEGRKLLLVDDNQVNLLIAEEFLAEYGFTITTATSGKKALDKAVNDDFDIIFMDCQMPEMDGYEATGILRDMMAKGSIKRAPIVALTANALKGDREKCLEAGMDEFLSKPMQTQSLKDMLDRLLARPEFAAVLTRPHGTPRHNEQVQERAMFMSNNEPAQPPAPRPMTPLMTDPLHLPSLPQQSNQSLSTMAAILAAAAPAMPAAAAPVAAPPMTLAPPVSAVAPFAAAQAPIAAPQLAAPQPIFAAVAPAAMPPQAPPPPFAAAAPVYAPPQAAAPAPAPAAQPRPAAQKTIPLMDFAEFEKTRNAMSKFDTLLSFYRNDTREYLDAIGAALMSGKPDGAILPAHTIKSSSRMLGASGMSALAASMETRLRTNQGASPAELDALRTRLEQVFDATLKQMDILMAAKARSERSA